MGNLCNRSELSEERQHAASSRLLLTLAEIGDSLDTRASDLTRDIDHNEIKIKQTWLRLQSGDISRLKYAQIARPLEAINCQLAKNLDANSREIIVNQQQQAQVHNFTQQIDRTSKLKTVAKDLRIVGIMDDASMDRVHDDVRDVMAAMSSVSDTHNAQINENDDSFDDIVEAKMQSVYAKLDDVEMMRIVASAPAALPRALRPTVEKNNISRTAMMASVREISDVSEDDEDVTIELGSLR